MSAGPGTPASAGSRIRVGIGGWTFEPWRNNFYPKGWSHARELNYASRKLSAIEVNGTYYSTMKAATFAKWRDDTPDDFVFALKANRFATNRRVLAEAGESVERFIGSGLHELGPKLGPIVWQFAPTKRFDPADFEAFLKLLPTSVQGLTLRHVMDVRHDTFKAPEYLALARQHQVATVFTDSDDYPSFADITGSFVYARLMRSQSKQPQGFEPRVLDGYATCALAWASGDEPDALPRVQAKAQAGPKGVAARDVFMFFISGAKERNPAAAMALIDRLA